MTYSYLRNRRVHPCGTLRGNVTREHSDHNPDQRRTIERDRVNESRWRSMSGVQQMAMAALCQTNFGQ